MTTRTGARPVTRTRRLATTGLVVIGGGALAIGAWLGGEPWLALMLGVFYLVIAMGTYVWAGGRGDVAALLRLSGDERQRLLDQRATAASGLTVIVFSLGGTAVNVARGGTGQPWSLICAVAGVSYVVALVVARHQH